MFLAFVRGTLEIAEVDFRDGDEKGERKNFLSQAFSCSMGEREELEIS